MRKFKIIWKSGDEEIIEGEDIVKAFGRAGYGGGWPIATSEKNYQKKIEECLSGWEEIKSPGERSEKDKETRAEEKNGTKL